jgi:uncharacterized coiled-coil protein SlyX
MVVKQDFEQSSDDQQSTAEPPHSSGVLCFRVGGDVKRVWDSLSKAEKLALTRFFRDAIVNYSSTRYIISISLRDLVDIAALLRSSYEACREELGRCRERCRDVEVARSEYNEKIRGLEDVVNKLKSELAKRDAELAKLKTRIENMPSLVKLKILVCSLSDKNAELKNELEKYNLLDLCKQI